MTRNFRTPASRKPSTICWRTGLPRTSIIGLGSSAVSSRIRVPRPAASTTALSIFVVMSSEAETSLDISEASLAAEGRNSKRFLHSGRNDRKCSRQAAANYRLAACAPQSHRSRSSFLFRDDPRRQVGLLDQFAHLGGIFLLNLCPVL